MSHLNVVDQSQEDFESCDLDAIDKNAAVDILHVEQEIQTTDNSEEPRNQIQNVIIHKMYMFFRELFLLLVIVFTYAAFQNTSPKISKSPNAFPFFPVGSIVKDWYDGQLSDAIELASQSDLAFVMYYAPWDAESQAVKYEFNIAAQHMYSQIHFAAINCWHPGSECRLQYSKVYSWPVLMAYPSHGRGIQYRGPKKAAHIVKFLQLMSNPIKRIYNLSEISKYQAINDAVVIGYMDARLGSTGYGVFYSTALRFLERDPFREIEFVVCTGLPGKSSFGDFTVPTLSLHLWNETLYYPTSNIWHPDTLLNWISDNLHQVSMWASPPGGKSETLSNYLQPGPALILFTPRNPLYSQIDYYTVLHSVALDYYNCGNKLDIQIQKSINWFLREEFSNVNKQLQSKCLISKNNKKFPTVVTCDMKKMWLNNTSGCARSNAHQSVCSEAKLKKDTCTNIIYSTSTVLNKESYKLHKEFDRDSAKKTTLQSPFNYIDGNDLRSPKNLQHLDETQKCHYFRLANELQPVLLAPLNFTTEEDESNISGLACKTNISLSMLAMDSLQYYHFAEGLGIDILNIEDKSAVVILNPALETHHVMKTPYSTINLENFIFEYTNGLLERTLSSTINNPQFTHLYSHQKLCRTTSNTFCIQELNTSNFRSTVLTENMVVIVMYYSTKCAFCSGVSHMLLTTAKILQPVNDLLFARIDGDKHDLPWEYSMHHYPSILFFPARRKSESRVFPQNVPITVTNLLSFVLANVDSYMEMHVMWAICKQTTFHGEFEICVRSMRTKCMTLIGQLLRAYRFSSNTQQRITLLKQLQNLRSLHFLLENPLHREEIQKYVTLLRFFEIVPKKSKSLH